MRLFFAVLVLVASGALQGWMLRRRHQRGELWAMSALTAAALTAFALYELRAEWLQYPMFLMRQVFTPIGDWILGR